MLHCGKPPTGIETPSVHLNSHQRTDHYRVGVGSHMWDGPIFGSVLPGTGHRESVFPSPPTGWWGDPRPVFRLCGAGGLPTFGSTETTSWRLVDSFCRRSFTVLPPLPPAVLPSHRQHSCCRMNQLPHLSTVAHMKYAGISSLRVFFDPFIFQQRCVNARQRPLLLVHRTSS